jgi:arylsulfatase A-like enzyme
MKQKCSKYFLMLVFAGIFSLGTMAQEKPNILVIMGDDIGWWNTSAYNHGMAGYKTPNIDRIANEGMMFTDAYAQQSCTAGRAAFILGQSPKRTGLLKIGMPGDEEGIDERDPTIAEILKPMGYATGQFGKNHLGDRDKHLPTNHGFDEFFGNLYHLNSEEEPFRDDYPKNPDFRKKYGPRGVLHSYADGKVEDTGPLSPKRMETIDSEFLEATIDFIEKAKKDEKPFFVWFNTTRMHIYTHLKEESKGITGLGVHADGMVEHDGQVGELLDKLEELGLADNTIVIYTTDNGAEKFSWPDGGISPFKGEKASTWEGGFRVPFMIKWPGKIKPGQTSNEILSLEDCFPTLVAAAGDNNIKDKLLKGYTAGSKNFKVHLDGYNFLPYLTGATKEGPRKEMYYFVDDGSLGAIRYNEFKANFSMQQSDGFGSWLNPQVPTKAPILVNLRTDPFEEAPEHSAYYEDYLINHMFLFSPIKDLTKDFAESFKEFPPRMTPGSFVPGK